MEIFLHIVVLAFLLNFMNSAAGMGLGTSFAPLLFLMGYTPLQVVPVLVINAAISGWIAGWFHHEFENVKFSLKKPLNKASKVMLLISGIGSLAIICGVLITYVAIDVPDIIIETYVAILVILMGLIGLIGIKKRSGWKYRPKLLAIFGGLAGFNKGVGGGGYGPVVVLGEIFSGIYEKSAVGIVSLAEGIVSTVGAIAFFTITAAGVNVDLVLLPSAFTGTFFAAIVGPYAVRVLPNKIWKIIIPTYAFTIGIVFLAELFLF